MIAFFNKFATTFIVVSVFDAFLGFRVLIVHVPCKLPLNPLQWFNTQEMDCVAVVGWGIFLKLRENCCMSSVFASQFYLYKAILSFWFKLV